jgi:WD40 repeat protein
LNSTSLSFGGSTAKSRYICVSDEGGYISVWDLKKQPVKRVRYFRLSHDTSVGSGGAEDQSFCSKACIHPTDTFVIGLHGCRPDDGVGGDTQVVKLDLFHLKNGGIISTLQDDGTHGGSSSCFHCSTMDPNQILVGTNDGSLLLWDISLSNSASHIPPMTILHKCHNDIVTDVAFSPMNKVLAASCSLDGTIVFNDVHSKTKIQSLRPAIGQQQQNQYYNGDSSDFGLTSLAFHENGYTWAVGTTNGFVMNYDLRQINAGPLSTINVGDVNEERTYPVNCIQFAPMQSMTMSSSKTPKSLKKKGKKTSSSTSNLNIEKVQQPSVLKDDDIEVVKHAFSGDSILKEVECGSPTIHSDLTKITIRDEKVENEVAKLNKDEHREVKSTAMESIPTIQSDLTKISIRDDIAKKFTNEVAKLNKDEHREVKSTAMENIQFHEQNHIFSEQNNLRHNVTDDNSIVDMPTTADTSTILQSFDRMYERLKSRENQPISPFNNDIDHTVIHSTGDDDKFMMITKVCIYSIFIDPLIFFHVMPN